MGKVQPNGAHLSPEWASRQKKKKKGGGGGKGKTERAMGIGRRTREKTVKWNQMTALRFYNNNNNKYISRALNPSVSNLYEAQGAVHVQ